VRKLGNVKPLHNFSKTKHFYILRAMSHLPQRATSRNNDVYLPYYIYTVVCCVLTLYFFPCQSFQCVACPAKKSRGNARAPCTSCPFFVVQYLCSIILCLPLGCWSIWTSSDNFHFQNASTQAQSVFTKGVIWTELRNKSHTSF